MNSIYSLCHSVMNISKKWKKKPKSKTYPQFMWTEQSWKNKRFLIIPLTCKFHFATVLTRICKTWVTERWHQSCFWCIPDHSSHYLWIIWLLLRCVLYQVSIVTSMMAPIVHAAEFVYVSVPLVTFIQQMSGILGYGSRCCRAIICIILYYIVKVFLKQSLKLVNSQP